MLEIKIPISPVDLYLSPVVSPAPVSVVVDKIIPPMAGLTTTRTDVMVTNILNTKPNILLLLLIQCKQLSMSFLSNPKL